MITEFGIHCGEPSTTYTSDDYTPGMPQDLIEIGHTMALDDYLANGPVPQQVKVYEWDGAIFNRLSILTSI